MLVTKFGIRKRYILHISGYLSIPDHIMSEKNLRESFVVACNVYKVTKKGNIRYFAKEIPKILAYAVLSLFHLLGY